MHHSTWTDAETCDRREFRDMLGSFMTGVTVVATRDEKGEAFAFTANSFTSVSLNPPLILVCLAKSALSFETFNRAKTFSVNILGDWQRNEANVFASRGPKKNAALASFNSGSPPVIESSLAVLVCAREQVVEAGDHVILIGRVQQFKSSLGEPLGYYRGSYVAFGLALQSLERLAAPLQVGGLLASGGRIVLCRRPGSADYEVPTTPLNPGERHSEVLRKLFGRLGISAVPTFPYSVFQDQGQLHTTMIFNMEGDGLISPSVREGTEVALFSAEQEPWKLVKGAMMQGMLERFFREHAVGCFGLYYDTDDGGRITPFGGTSLHWKEWNPNRPNTSSGP
jgi:flavin-dependent trigonelline monooxygenase, reductase component